MYGKAVTREFNWIIAFHAVGFHFKVRKVTEQQKHDCLLYSAINYKLQEPKSEFMGFQGLKNENQIQGQTFQVPYES